MDAGPARLTVDAARQLTFKATAPARTTEEHLYDMCLKRVRQEACAGGTRARCSMPRFIFGMPLFSQRIMRDQLAMRFEREGWSVECLGADELVIGWGQGATVKAKPKPHRKSAPVGKTNGKAPGVRR